jgi:hypothetical protein
MAPAAEQVWQVVGADAGNCAIGYQLFQLDLAAFRIKNDKRSVPD